MTNRLAGETSPYLRQHARNPVDWWPWCDEALATARAQNMPILLSIGYAACHWCHVMAHESFEDPDVARVMNALYVNIKVDREERPDIDKVYQLAHQALARRGGGWPLTMFLTPGDLLPIYAGTYFPKTPRYGMPGFVQVLEGVRAWFNDKPDEVRAQNDSLARFLAQHSHGDAYADALDAKPIQLAIERIAANFDSDNGGHRGGPKFPHASEIELLLQPRSRRERGSGEGKSDPSSTDAAPPDSILQASLSGREDEQSMARLTLDRMAERGLNDHLGGGFFRYSVDERWEIPHFEKMLYDNASLLPLYASAAHRFGDARFAAAARACAAWVEREMCAASGGFWSSLDADSEGEEGRYYVWQREEIRTLLTEVEFAVAAPYFGLEREPNFEGRAWHLLLATSIDEVAARTGLDRAEIDRCLTRTKHKLLAARELRARPGLDDKILTAWNAMMVGGTARSGRWLADQPLMHQAERALDFLHANVWKDGRLYACHAGGVAKFPAYLDDHAFLLDALLAMLQVRWKLRDFEWAIALADTMLERFEDRDNGGFFFTAHDAEALPQRPKPFMDESLPSGNGIAARALLKLGRLLGETRYLDAAERCLRAAWPALMQHPEACCTLLLALDEFLHPGTHIVVRFVDEDAALAWRTALSMHASADMEAWFIPADVEALPGALEHPERSTPVVAYLCTGTTCDPPLRHLDEFTAALRAIAWH